jgi:hypothetical protein
MFTRGKQAEKEIDICESLLPPDLRAQMKIVYVAQKGVGRRKEQSHMETCALQSYLKNTACRRQRKKHLCHTQADHQYCSKLKVEEKAYTNKIGHCALSK